MKISNREQWLVKNISSKATACGDLPKISALAPNQQVDALNFYTKEQLQQSPVFLQMLVNSQWQLTKSLDNVIQVISPTNAENALTEINQNQITKINGLYLNVTNTSTNYTTLLSDDIILINTSGSNKIITLTTSINNKGKIFRFIKTNNTNSELIVITPVLSQTINNLANTSTANQFQTISIVSDNANWIIL